MADITYLPAQGQCVYQSLVTDVYSKKITDWHMHESLQAEEVAHTMKNGRSL